MVQQSENDVAATIKLSGVHLTTTQDCARARNTPANATALNNIVSQVVEELCDTVKTTPITHVVLTGTKRRQIHRLMSHHPAMPVALMLIAEAVDGEHGANIVRDQAQFVYSINTDCYPFSSRFS